MQTFLPYRDFKQSAICLDKKRQFKQVVEASQIYNTLIHKRKAWQNHPAVLMWKGYEDALAEYHNVCWEVAKEKWGIKFVKLSKIAMGDVVIYPPWLGNEKFHASHRSNLLRKNIEYYSQFGWTEPPNLEYFWPTKEGY